MTIALPHAHQPVKLSVKAQYFRDPARLPTYLASNLFLADINNEVTDARNESYAKNFASLDNFVMIMFSEDKTVVPKESAWFGSYAPPSPDDSLGDLPILVPMKAQPLYIEDWIGLRQLDEDGGVLLHICEGRHMHITTDCWKPLVQKYVGGLSDDVKSSSLLLQADR